MNSFTIEAGSIGTGLDATFARLERLRFADALWNRRLEVWTSDGATQQKIANRLGWLDVLDFVGPQLPRLRAFADGIRNAGFTDVVLLGMGGSSLAPEVLHQIAGRAAGSPRFRMLDSTDPDEVRDAMSRAASSLFVFASKSGTTIEPNTMAAEAMRRVEAAGHRPGGSCFVAVTDEGTALDNRARSEQFRDVFVNPADIGGRYSALSLFGLVPASLMGIELERLLSSARAMAEACRSADPRTNPGLALGAVIGAAAAAGRDKLTLVVPPRLASFGLWVEQLVAESTGKQGKGIVPIANESPRARYGRDRAAVAVHLADDSPDPAVVDQLRASGAPVVAIHMADSFAVGAEFFRWEVATATAGLLLGINPFDEPNVQQAKDATKSLLDTYVSQRRLPVPEPHASSDGVRMSLSRAAQRIAMAGAQSFLKLLGAGDYFALLAYLPPHAPDYIPALDRLRSEVAARTGCATMFGYGPRYLHSTGQLHKGGASNGVFIVITAAPAEDLPIPGVPYSFGVLETAQALGDFASLEKTGRRAMLLQLPTRDPRVLTNAVEILLRAI